MELVKKNIHMNRWKGRVSTQITLDDDFIVPDTMDDMEQVVLNTGEIVIESTKNQGERVNIKGKLEFRVLYRRAEGGLQTLGGSIPFEEMVNVPGLEEKDYLQVKWELEDLNAGIINSRKLSIKAMVTLNVHTESLCDLEAAVDISEGGVQSLEGVQVQVRKKNIHVAAVAIRKKDTHRIKETIQVSGNKPNIDQVLWSQIRLGGVNSKPLDGKVVVSGELFVFVIYSGEGENTPIQWIEEVVAFSGELDLPDAVEEMVPAIGVHLIHKEVEAKPDYDGELRELEVDAILDIDIKLYEEQDLEVLSDLYSTNRELVLQTKEAAFDQILVKNISKCKVAEKMKMDHPERILQICHSQGNVRLDDVRVHEDGLHVEGVLEVELLYLTADDTDPVKSAMEVVPFSYTIEAKGMNENNAYQLSPGIEQMNTVMMGSDTIEVKAVIALDLLVLQSVSEQIIHSVSVNPLDVQRLQQMPGIVGYIVQPQDTLWDVAKKFHTTMDTVMVSNGLVEDNIKSGDRLLLIKELS